MAKNDKSRSGELANPLRFRNYEIRVGAIGHEAHASARKAPPSLVNRRNTSKNGNDLSERELAVARRLLDGVQRKALAPELGISVSTLDKHLASIRRKVGSVGLASTLNQLRQRLASHDFASPAAPRSSSNARNGAGLAKLSAVLAASASFDEAWPMLFDYARSFGVTDLAIGVGVRAAAPSEDRFRLLVWTLPEELDRMLGDNITPVVSPIVQHAREQRIPLISDIARVFLPLIGTQIPETARVWANTLIESGLGCGVTIPLMLPEDDTYGAAAFIFGDALTAPFEQVAESTLGSLYLVSQMVAPLALAAFQEVAE